MPLVQTRGAASAQGFGEFAQQTAANYIEDVFSTWLYTGNGSTQTITNGIDLSGEGGLVWIKKRTGSSVMSHYLTDTARGVTDGYISSNTTNASNPTQVCNAFNNNGFGYNPVVSDTGDLICSWTFRKAAKFFDVVTYTGDGSSNRQIAHNLGSVPGMMVVKMYSAGGTRWNVYHRAASATPQNGRLALNTTDPYLEYPAIPSFDTLWNLTQPTDTVFTVGSNNDVNQSGQTYVAYLFAHDAGGFGTSGTDNVISCGSVVGAGNPTEVNLGYEPQFLLIKNASSAQDWWLVDNMRGLVVENASASARLNANTSGAEITLNVRPTATGFISGSMSSGATYIYMAMRRGPMKVPTTGTSVFGDISALEPVSTNQTTENGVLADLVINGIRINQGGFGPHWLSRLTGNGVSLVSSSTAAEFNPGNFWNFDNNNFAYISPNGYANNNGTKKYVAYSFKRAPGFFDVVCYTGDGASTRQVTHNLGVTPQLIIIKNRGVADSWEVRYPSVANNKDMLLNSTGSQSNLAFTPADTITTFTVSVSGSAATNDNANTYVAYLFATCPSVSKVGSYTGNGGTQAIACGFTGGARFVLIKRTDASGDWYVYDTARGMTTLTDPYLLLNSTAAETATLGSVTTTAGGFTVNSAILAAINSSGGTYIFLAIA